MTYRIAQNLRIPFPALLITVGLLSASLLVAAPAAPRPPATKPVPAVLVTKTDGTTVRGQIVSAAPMSVTIKPAAKPGEAASEETVTVAWREIKSVSNGLTRAKAAEQFKAEHAGKLCETCRGDQAVTCATCKGVGHDPAASKDCKTCGGAMEVACKTPKCTEGKITCPKPCLKLTEGQWVKKDDGKRWRSFRGRSGTMTVSDGHLGQVVTVVNGDPTLGEMCTTCGGATTIPDPACRGTGKTPCATCKSIKGAADCATCEAGETACATCSGTGLRKE